MTWIPFNTFAICRESSVPLTLQKWDAVQELELCKHNASSGIVRFCVQNIGLLKKIHHATSRNLNVCHEAVKCAFSTIIGYCGFSEIASASTQKFNRGYYSSTLWMFKFLEKFHFRWKCLWHIFAAPSLHTWNIWYSSITFVILISLMSTLAQTIDIPLKTSSAIANFFENGENKKVSDN